MGKIKWGFDLTDFGSAKTFEALLKRHGLSSGYKRVRRKYSIDNDKKPPWYSYTWSNSKLKLVTGNNPITGKYSVPKQRKSEKGYASYIGIEGELYEVRVLVEDIKRSASFKGDESPGKRDYI